MDILILIYIIKKYIFLYYKMNLSVEHVLMFALVVCVFYYMRCNRVEGYSQDPDNCILKSVAEEGGTEECLKRGGFGNEGLYKFYKDNNPSLYDMVNRINSGQVHEGGFNVRNPEKCVNRVKECYA